MVTEIQKEQKHTLVVVSTKSKRLSENQASKVHRNESTSGHQRKEDMP